MITFRPTRGGFDQAIRDSKNFYSLDEFMRFILEDKYDYYRLRYWLNIEEIIKFYPPRYDYRISAFASLVVLNRGDGFFPCGHIW